MKTAILLPFTILLVLILLILIMAECLYSLFARYNSHMKLMTINILFRVDEAKAVNIVIDELVALAQEEE